MSLYQKGLLAFALVILIAVATVALLVGFRTTGEFRQYALLYSGATQNLAAALADYFILTGSWEGVQAQLPELAPGGAARGAQGRGRSDRDAGAGAPSWDFLVTDAQGNVVGYLGDSPAGALSDADLALALPIVIQGEVVGYLLPDQTAVHTVELGTAERKFLEEVWAGLGIGAGVAFLAAILVGGVLVRGIVRPVRRLTTAAEAIATGQLGTRAAFRGRDEVAQLGRAFNSMAESLERAKEARQAQTADIAHELRNPLAVLQGTLEALADGIYEPTPENVEPAVAQVQTLNRLVEDLRVLALADAGELHLERAPLDLRALLERVGRAHYAALEEHRITFIIDLPNGLPLVAADADRLAQVLTNLLSNAARYVPAGGTVRLGAVSQDGGVLVRVSDNGVGAPPDQLPYLFERFWRGERSRSRATGGSGLGLAIARRIIEGHGGRIWAEPTPGGGLTLLFWLPETR
ncbi:MAG: HAMP domain-containing protein [Anaerolineae bacterium]|nr:HAMP domain-containing protein [Anaerolineae bacterium]